MFRVQREWEYMYSVSSWGCCRSSNDNGEQSSPFLTNEMSHFEDIRERHLLKAAASLSEMPTPEAR